MQRCVSGEASGSRSEQRCRCTAGIHDQEGGGGLEIISTAFKQLVISLGAQEKEEEKKKKNNNNRKEEEE